MKIHPLPQQNRLFNCIIWKGGIGESFEVTLPILPKINTELVLEDDDGIMTSKYLGIKITKYKVLTEPLPMILKNGYVKYALRLEKI